MPRDDIVVIGAGGHAKVVLDAILLGDRYRIAGLIAADGETGTDVLGVPVIGALHELPRLKNDGLRYAFVGMGSIGNPSARIAAAREVEHCGLSMPPIVHPAASVSPHAVLHAGVFVAANAVVGAGARVGTCAIVNSGAVVEHDCAVGEFAHISPGVSLSGGVGVGDRSHVGTGSAVVQYASIGSDVLLGAGSVVVNDIEDGVLAYGNPARVISRRG